jgi:histidinol phosphatase-like PHP family hydrolase
MSTPRSEFRVTRRLFLRQSAAAGGLVLVSNRLRAADADPAPAGGPGFPLIDFHVHLDNSTIDQVLELSGPRGVKFGIVEHAGTKENKYPVVLSNDAELKRYLAMLEGKPVFKGVQAEWTDWMGCFSPGALAQLDYVLTDAMTFPDKLGQRHKLWEPGLDLEDKEAFMDRYVEWHVEIMAKEPIDILANTTWLPAALAPDYDRLWTPARMQRVVDAALRHRVALEISSSYKLPRLPFLKLAKAAGAKFSFGSNGRYPNMGRLDYCVAVARDLGLERSDMFTPAPDGQKAVQRRKWA